jgi:hypothetical protein
MYNNGRADTLSGRSNESIHAEQFVRSFQVYFFNSLGFKYAGVKNFMGKQVGFPLWSMLRLPSQAVQNSG